MMHLSFVYSLRCRRGRLEEACSGLSHFDYQVAHDRGSSEMHRLAHPDRVRTLEEEADI